MDLIFWIVFILSVLILLTCGFAIKYRKAYWLISGYNTMSDKDKKQVDIEKLGKLMTNTLFILSGFLEVATLMALSQIILGIILLLALVPLISIYTMIKALKYYNYRKRHGRTGGRPDRK